MYYRSVGLSKWKVVQYIKRPESLLQCLTLHYTVGILAIAHMTDSISTIVIVNSFTGNYRFIKHSDGADDSTEIIEGIT